MARKRNQYDHENVALRYELLGILITFAEEHNGALPIERRAWRMCYDAGYQIREETFNYHWKILKDEGFITVDPHTATPYIPRSKWVWQSEIPDAI